MDGTFKNVCMNVCMLCNSSYHGKKWNLSSTSKQEPSSLNVALRQRNQRQEDNDRGIGHVYQIFFVYNVGHSKSSRYHAEVHMVTTLKEGLRSLKSDMGYWWLDRIQSSLFLSLQCNKPFQPLFQRYVPVHVNTNYKLSVSQYNVIIKFKKRNPTMIYISIFKNPPCYWGW